MSAAEPPGHPGSLTTARLELRPIAPGDAAGLFPLMSDPRVTRFLAWEPHDSIDTTRALLKGLADAAERGDGYHWIVLEGGEPAGVVSLIDVRRVHRAWRLDRAEIAYWIAPEREGRGLATEATAAIVEAAFSRLHLNRLIVSHTSENPASGRIAVKLGFRYVGREREFFMKNGTWYDMNHYELLARDWERATET